MVSDATLRTRLLAIIAGLAILASLRASYPVTMPLAFALVVIAAIWPVKPYLDRLLPSWVSYAGTVVLFLATLTAFAGAIYFAAAEAVRALIQHWGALESAYDAAVRWADRKGLPIDLTGDRRAFAFAQQMVSEAYALVGHLGLVGVLVVLGLPEVPAAYAKVRAHLSAAAQQELLDLVAEVAEKVRRYLAVTVFTSFVTGIATAVWSHVMGLDLALSWGVLNFLLNFVPVIGNLIGIVPPTLYAIVQFDGAAWPALIFAGFAIIQLTISNVLYPYLQRKSLALSPVGIVVALAFWGWLWGIAGALIAVPLTATLVIVCDAFDQTRWIARALAR